MGQKARLPSQICETPGLSAHPDHEARRLGDGGLGDGVVFAFREGPQLPHLAEDDDEAALFAPRDRRGGLEARDHRGAVGVVGIVQNQRTRAAGDEPQTALIVVARQLVEGAVEQLLGDGLVRQRAERGHRREGREDAGFAEQGGRDDDLFASEQIARQGELGAVVWGRDLADDAERVPTTAVAEPFARIRAGQLGLGAIVISVDDGDLAGGGQERALFISYLVDVAEPLGVGRRDERQDAHVGRGDLGQASDLTGAAGAELDDADLVVVLEAEENQGYTDEIVQVSGGRVDDADAVQERRDRLASRRLAGRASDAHDQAALAVGPSDPPSPVKRSEVPERVGGVGDQQNGAGGGERRGRITGHLARDDDAGGAGDEGLVGMVVAVETRALDRDEDAPRSDRAGVGDDGDAASRRAADGEAARSRGDTQLVERESGTVLGQRGRHQQTSARPSRSSVPTGRGVRPRSRKAARASSRSSNAETTSPMIWYGSCPLPARSTVSPGWAWPMAWRIAARRSSSTIVSLVFPASAIPATIASAMASGASLRGLSFVTMSRSAPWAATCPMIGRFCASRSPPQPKTQCSVPSVTGRKAASTRSRASGVWA
jgi:hypothetical protein